MPDDEQKKDDEKAPAPAEGVICALGDLNGGWSFYLVGGYIGIEHPQLRTDRAGIGERQTDLKAEIVSLPQARLWHRTLPSIPNWPIMVGAEAVQPAESETGASPAFSGF